MTTPIVYANFKLKQNNGNALVLQTDVIKCGILNSTYVPNIATDTLWSGISANEVSGTNYTAGGAAIAGVTLAISGNNVPWIHNNITWLQSAGGFSNGRYVVWYGSVSGKLIAVFDNGVNFGNVLGDLVLSVDPTNGTLNIQ